MNQELLEEMIAHWEPPGGECIRTIDTDEDTVSRVIKYPAELACNVTYCLFRYFTLSNDTPGNGERVCVSIDLQDVDADRVIQHLAEQL